LLQKCEVTSLSDEGRLIVISYRKSLEVYGSDVFKQLELEPEAAGYFEQLLPAWIQAAYAARMPDQARVEGLCARYDQSFGSRAAMAQARPP